MITLTIDERRHDLDCALDAPLLVALREHAGLAGTPAGCLIGMCGACTVLLDGRPVRACSTPVSAAVGARVATVEGIAASAVGRALLKALREHAGEPCTQCGPGRLVAAAALLGANPTPDAEAIEAALADYACACERPLDLEAIVLGAAKALAAVRTHS